MWIQYKDGYEEFIEIKYTRDLSKENVKKQIYIQKSWCEKNSKNHRVVTEEDIKQSPIKVSNMKLILNLIKTRVEDITVIEKLKKVILEASEKLTIERLSLLSKIEYNQTLKVVALLIYSNEIKSNFSVKTFGKKTEVWL